MSKLKKTEQQLKELERARIASYQIQAEIEIEAAMTGALKNKGITPTPAIIANIATELLGYQILNPSEIIDFINYKFGNETDIVNTYSLSDLKERLGL